MKRMISTLVVITLVLLLSQPARAQRGGAIEAQEKLRKTYINPVMVDVTKFDILGIRLGMTLDEVKKEIKKTFPEGKIKEDPALPSWVEFRIKIISENNNAIKALAGC